MKHSFNLFILAILSNLVLNRVYGQGAFITMHTGYGLKTSSQNYFYNYTEGENSYTEEQVNVSLGQGLDLGASIGYMFNEHIGTDLGISYLIGSKRTAHDIYMDPYFGNSTTDYSMYANMLRINPSIVISGGSRKLSPYAKFGILFGSGTVKYEINAVEDNEVLSMKMKMNGGLSVGLTSGIGANLKINDKMALFGEIQAINMSYSPTKGKLTELTEAGVDLLPELTTSEKETEFVDSHTFNYENPPSDSKPSQELKQKLPFGSVGFNLGIRMNL